MVELFAEKIIRPLDDLNDDESLAFWLYWKEECEVYEIQKHVLRCMPGGMVELGLKKQLCAWSRRHLKPREVLAQYLNEKQSKSCLWRSTRERMRWIMNHECRKHYHWGYCRCSKCLKLYYVKGDFTMIVVRVKENIFDLRQFNDEARNHLINMISKEELVMLMPSKNEGDAVKTVSRPRAIYLCQKYNYPQNVVESMQLANED